MKRWISALSALLFIMPVLLLMQPAGATPYMIHGQVTWSDGLSPVSGAVVTITNVDRDPSVYTLSTTTDENGYYTLSPGVNEPGDFANESQTINITVTYTTSKGEVIHAYADPIVVGSSQETAFNHSVEINFSLTPPPDTPDSGPNMSTIIAAVVLIALAVVVVVLFLRKRRSETEGREKGR